MENFESSDVKSVKRAKVFFTTLCSCLFTVAVVALVLMLWHFQEFHKWNSNKSSAEETLRGVEERVRLKTSAFVELEQNTATRAAYLLETEGAKAALDITTTNLAIKAEQAAAAELLNATLSVRNEALENENAFMETTKAKLENEVETLRKEQAAWAQKVDESKASALKLTDDIAALNKSKTELQPSQRALEAVKNGLDEAATQKNKIDLETKALETANNALALRKAELEKEVADFEKRLQTARVAAEKTEADLTAAEARLQQTSAVLEKAREEAGTLRDSLVETRTQRTMLAEQNAGLAKQKEELEASVIKLTLRNTQLDAVFNERMKIPDDPAGENAAP